MCYVCVNGLLCDLYICPFERGAMFYSNLTFRGCLNVSMTKPFAELLNTNVHIDISLQADMLGLIRPKYRNSKQRGTGGKISISLLEITDIYISGCA